MAGARGADTLFAGELPGEMSGETSFSLFSFNDILCLFGVKYTLFETLLPITCTCIQKATLRRRPWTNINNHGLIPPIKRLHSHPTVPPRRIKFYHESNRHRNRQTNMQSVRQYLSRPLRPLPGCTFPLSQSVQYQKVILVIAFIHCR